MKSFLDNSEKLAGLTKCKVNIHVKESPGITLQTISRRVAHLSRTWAPDIIIIFAGLCSFTTKLRDEASVKLVYYSSDGATQSTAKEIIDDLLDTYGGKIHIATIPPADILKHNQCKDNKWKPCEDDEKQQLDLVKDVETVNEHIVERNKIRNSPTLLTARQTYVSKLRKDKKTGRKTYVRKFNPKNLHDGVHADQLLEKIWFERIEIFLHQLIQTDSRKPLTTSSEEDTSKYPVKEDTSSSSEEETYNHKRRRYNR